MKRTLSLSRLQESSQGLLLGESLPSVRSFGFGETLPASTSGELIVYGGEAHLCTFAPTRSGKGTGAIIPNLLNYGGTIICFDPKGENYLVTSRSRRARGQQVVKLDPFGLIDEQTDAINPLDALLLPNADLESDSQTLAEAISRGMTTARDPFWDNSACGLLSAALMVAATRPAPTRHLGYALDLLSSDDVVYGLACLLDQQGKTLPQAAVREIAAFLQTAEITRSGILSVAQSYLKAFAVARVRRSFESSTFSLSDLVKSKPLTIYMILPSERIGSHTAILKLWLATFFKAILARRTQPHLKTLVLLDEAGQLGGFPYIETMATLCAGYGLWLWLIYQDLAQLQSAFEKSWKTLLSSCGVLQVFGISNRQTAQQWSECLDSSITELRRIKPDEQLLLIHNSVEQRSRRLNYLTDQRFAGLWDGNRLYARPASAPAEEFCESLGGR